MTDNKAQNYLLKMPRIKRIYVEPFGHGEMLACVLKAAVFGFLTAVALFLLSVFVFPIELWFTLACAFSVFAVTIMIFRVNAFRNETLRTIQLCSGYTAHALPADVPIVKAALCIPFRNRRIPLRTFEADVPVFRANIESAVISHHHAKQVGTHVIENALVLKPGKVCFEQSATVTSFGIMLRDFAHENRNANRRAD